MKRKLWLRIARHFMQDERNVNKAMEVLRECPELKIEDILPFFPDFVQIDPFQEHIQRSLELYNDQIHASLGQRQMLCANDYFAGFLTIVLLLSLL